MADVEVAAGRRPIRVRSCRDRIRAGSAGGGEWHEVGSGGAVLELLNEIGARNAVGRIDLVENRFVGIKSRGCYETPGGTLLLTAHRELEALCLDRELMHFKQHIALKYAELVYFGLWFTPLRESLDAFVEQHAEDVTGIGEARALQGQRDRWRAEVGVSLYRTDFRRSPWATATTRRTRQGSSTFLGLPARSRAWLQKKDSKKKNETVRGGSEEIKVKMWSGRFRQPLDPEFEQWQRSFPFDRRLLGDEVAASTAHARALAEGRRPDAAELAAIATALSRLGDADERFAR